MNRTLKLMLLIAVIWGTLAAAFLLIFHSMFVVDIHWKEDKLRNERRFNLNLLTENENDHTPNAITIFPTHMRTAVMKLRSLPVHTQDLLAMVCADPQCIDHLSVKERSFYNNCKEKTIAKETKFGPILNTSQCRFQNGTNRFPVALASFPGSGNTWLRGLLEKVTGICTGALYCDSGLRTKGFTGEGVRGASVLVIKTHGKGALFTNRKLPKRILNDAPVYGGAILLVRNPRRAMIAEWHRERSKRQVNSTVSNHYLYVGKEYFGANELWDKYIQDRMERWKSHISGWIVDGKFNPFLVIKYEDVKNNSAKEVLKMVKFLGFQDLFTEGSIQAKLREGYNSFYRNHEDNFEHFTTQQSQLISRTVTETMQFLADNGMQNSFPIKDYV